jgi:hypothetical protein
VEVPVTRLPHTRRPHKRLAIGRKVQEWLDDDRRRGLGPTTDEAYFQAHPEAEFRMPPASPAEVHVANILTMVPHALETMEAWGFVYKTNFAWVKDRPAPAIGISTSMGCY